MRLLKKEPGTVVKKNLFPTLFLEWDLFSKVRTIEMLQKLLHSSRLLVSPSLSLVPQFAQNPIIGHDGVHLATLRDIDDGGIEEFFEALLALRLVEGSADLAVLQRLVKGVRRLRDGDDIGADTPETEVTAGDQRDEETEQKPDSVAGENVPPVMPVVAHSGHRTRHGPHGH